MYQIHTSVILSSQLHQPTSLHVLVCARPVGRKWNGGACFCKKSGSFLNAGCIMYSIVIFLFYILLYQRIPLLMGLWACALHHQSTLRTSVQENVRNNSEKRKKSCFFLDFDKNVKTHVQFQRHLITPDFNSQLPKVSSGRSPTSNTLLRNAGVVFTFTRNYATWSCVWHVCMFSDTDWQINKLKWITVVTERSRPSLYDTDWQLRTLVSKS